MQSPSGSLVKHIICQPVLFVKYKTAGEPAHAPWQYNILTQTASRAAIVPVLSLGQEGMLMTTYEEFMIIIAVTSLIVSIINMKNKQAALLSGKE